MILDNNSSLCESNFIGDRTVFHYSAFFNDRETLDYLVKKCTDTLLHKPDIITKEPLVYAIENNATKVLDILFEHGGKCPESIENIYLKTYIGGELVYKKGHYRTIESFIVNYNLPELAEVLTKNKCIDIDKKIQWGENIWITWTDWMEKDIRGTLYMKKTMIEYGNLKKIIPNLLKCLKNIQKRQIQHKG